MLRFVGKFNRSACQSSADLHRIGFDAVSIMWLAGGLAARLDL